MPKYIDRERARELIEDEKKTITETAEILGCGRRQLSNLKNAGWPEMKRYYTTDPAKVAYLTRLGWSAARIAAELECSPRNVQRIRGHLEMRQGKVGNPTGGSLSEERYEMAATLVREGASVGEISRTLRMSRDTINKYWPEAKQNADDWRHLWGQIRNNPKMRRLFDEMGGIA